MYGLPTVTAPHGTTGYEIATGICIDVCTCVHMWFAYVYICGLLTATTCAN